MSQSTRTCKECQSVFVVEPRFGHKKFCSIKCKRRTNNRDGVKAQKKWAKEHPEAFRAYAKRYREKNPEKFQKAHRLKRYNLSEERFTSLLSLQDGKCALCRETMGDDMVVDHDHSCCGSEKSCGKCIRGIIHRQCNIGIGAFKDDPEKCRRAVLYLERYLNDRHPS
jgi:hypothetical protein